MTREDLLIDLIAAYKDARRRIRSRRYQLVFELNMESELVKLRDELWLHQWSPGPSEAFIVFYPVQREVFASQFRDRIVHHLLYNYISPLIEKSFIRDSYACRKGKGTSDAVKRFNHHLQSSTNRFHKKAYVLKMDIQGYFMSINHIRLEELLHNHIERYLNDSLDRDFIYYLAHTIIFNDVTENCVIRGRKSDWIGLPLCKSLFNNNKEIGLPIGDLTSQMFSNIYLNELDQYAKRVLKCKHYGRYVDDFFIIDNDEEHLLALKNEIEVFLIDNLGLKIHPGKTRLQSADWPMSFMGHRIHPHYMTPSGRVIHQFKRKVYRIKRDCANIIENMPYGGIMNESQYSFLSLIGDDVVWDAAVAEHSKRLARDNSILNSYLGFFRRDKAFHFVGDTLSSFEGDVISDNRDNSFFKLFYFDNTLKKANICNWYKNRNRYSYNETNQLY